MANERNGHGILYPAEYMRAISEALVCWVGLEWMAVHCALLFDEDFTNRIRKLPVKKPGPMDGRQWTGGVIASAFVELASGDKICPDDRLAKAARRFKELVKTRNRFFHAYPAAGATPDVATLYHLEEGRWELSQIQNFADEAAICSNELNHLYYHFLRPALVAQK